MNTRQQGFTLIELMVTVMIVALLAAIAVPSYQRYIVKNAEDEAKAQMGQLELQLQRWRASALTYRGFVPVSGADASGNTTYGYGRNNSIIYIPLGSNANNFRYQIELVDISATTGGVANSLVPTGTDVNASKGRGYKMVAYPATHLENRGAHRFVVLSTGTRCTVPSNTRSILAMTANDTCTTKGWEAW